MEIQVFHGTQEQCQSEETYGIYEQNVVKYQEDDMNRIRDQP